MIWLASFPRSGNTFVRNILFEVYGLESSTFHDDPDYHFDEKYLDYPIVKTHLLPEQVKPIDSSIPAVCILRDGRDALVSIAHHRKDIIAPGSDYYDNLKAAIIAEKGSFFGGWSNNVINWIQRADLVIRYENLLIDPIREVERIRSVIDLPKPDKSKMPQFEDMKFGIPHYGSGFDRGYSESKMRELSQKNFRKGKAGGWKDEMPEELQDVFWSYHGETMEKLGYSYEGEIVDLHQDLDNEIRIKLGLPEPEPPARKYKVLIESNKIVSPDNDGVKRYQVEILKGLLPTINNPLSKWSFDLYVHGKIIPLSNFKSEIANDFIETDFNNEEKKHTDPDHVHKRKKGIIEKTETLLVSLV
ncbi:MAG: sulfotransferase domain-containing protein, partial [Bacteroidales bacterium]|nr:sulfotransferase domain-containing protein [Bacteroidales bacterium]